MKKISKPIYILPTLSLIMVCSSCVKQNIAPDEAKPVVESYLQPGQPATVKLSKQIPVDESQSGDYTITNATVKIVYQGTSYDLPHTAGGVYVNKQIPIISGNTYNLNISYNGLAITASTTIPAKPQGVTQSATSITAPVFGSGMPTIPQPISITWSNPNSEYFFVVVKPTDTTSAIGNFPGGGGGFAGFGGTVDQGSQRNVNINSFRYYGKHYMLLYHVQSDYAAYYNTTGSSSLNLTNIPTTIVNGFGIFTGVMPSDSLFVQVN